MERTDPKQLAPIESIPDSNAPITDDRQRRPSSLPEVSHSTHYSPRDFRVQASSTANDIDQLQNHKKRNTKLFIALIAATIFLIAIALGAGLGIGLHKHKTSTAVKNHGAISRSGIVAIDLDNTIKITAYTQRYNGVIVRNEYLDGVWIGDSNIYNLDT